MKSIFFPFLFLSVSISFSFGDSVFKFQDLDDSASIYFSLNGLRKKNGGGDCENKNEKSGFVIRGESDLVFENKIVGNADTILFQTKIDGKPFCITSRWYNKKNSLLSLLRFLISHPIQVEDIDLVRISTKHEINSFKLLESRQGTKWDVRLCTDATGVPKGFE